LTKNRKKLPFGCKKIGLLKVNVSARRNERNELPAKDILITAQLCNCHIWQFTLNRFKSYNGSFINFIKRFGQWNRESFWASGWPVKIVRFKQHPALKGKERYKSS
jgi:hypothetical protein